MKTIFICGLPGSGKSTFGEKLANYMDLSWLDTDHWLEQHTLGKSIPEFVEKQGWEAFRKAERDLLQDVLKDTNQKVVSLGGGSLVNNKLVHDITKNHVLIYLKATPSDLIKHFTTEELSKRPLLKGENSANLRRDLEDLLRKRRGKYEQSHVITDLESTHNLDLFTKRLHLFTSPPRKH